VTDGADSADNSKGFLIKNRPIRHLLSVFMGLFPTAALPQKAKTTEEVQVPMTKPIGDLKATLDSATDGGIACDAINALSNHAKKGNEEAKMVLADYVCNGSIGHMREHACACLAAGATRTDVELVAIFQRGLSDSQIRYWSILGCINSVGKGVYEELIRIARDETIPVEHRSQAVKCLATASKQPNRKRRTI
jgi:hypothetical protein